jgi:hypothetical protein
MFDLYPHIIYSNYNTPGSIEFLGMTSIMRLPNGTFMFKATSQELYEKATSEECIENFLTRLKTAFYVMAPHEPFPARARLLINEWEEYQAMDKGYLFNTTQQFNSIKPEYKVLHTYRDLFNDVEEWKMHAVGRGVGEHKYTVREHKAHMCAFDTLRPELGKELRKNISQWGDYIDDGFIPDALYDKIFNKHDHPFHKDRKNPKTLTFLSEHAVGYDNYVEDMYNFLRYVSSDASGDHLEVRNYLDSCVIYDPLHDDIILPNFTQRDMQIIAKFNLFRLNIDMIHKIYDDDKYVKYVNLRRSFDKLTKRLLKRGVFESVFCGQDQIDLQAEYGIVPLNVNPILLAEEEPILSNDDLREMFLDYEVLDQYPDAGKGLGIKKLHKLNKKLNKKMRDDLSPIFSLPEAQKTYYTDMHKMFEAEIFAANNPNSIEGSGYEGLLFPDYAYRRPWSYVSRYEMSGIKWEYLSKKEMKAVKKNRDDLKITIFDFDGEMELYCKLKGIYSEKYENDAVRDSEDYRRVTFKDEFDEISDRFITKQEAMIIANMRGEKASLISIDPLAYEFEDDIPKAKPTFVAGIGMVSSDAEIKKAKRKQKKAAQGKEEGLVDKKIKDKIHDMNIKNADKMFVRNKKDFKRKRKEEKALLAI